MAGFSSCFAVLATLALAAPPDLPPDETGATPAETSEPSEPSSATEPAPVQPVEPVVAPEPEPVVEPAPTPAPPSITVAPAYDDEVAPRAPRRSSEQDEEDDEIHRFEPGQWGMQFTFGGLAPMNVAGVRDFGINRLTFTEIGFRRVLGNNWMIPFSIGAGVFNHGPEGADSQNDVGLAFSVGVQRYFRVWRRIAPFSGGRFRLHYAEPNGRANWMFGIGLGPVLGIEYFVGHRVSLTLQGTALLGVGVFSGLLQIEAATQLDAGGQMGLTFYF